MGQGAPMPVPPAQQQNASFSAIPGLAAASGMNPMMTDMAMQYGQDMMGKGQEELKKNLDKYVSIGQLKYYFAVDTTYVAKKLGGWRECGEMRFIVMLSTVAFFSPPQVSFCSRSVTPTGL